MSPLPRPMTGPPVAVGKRGQMSDSTKLNFVRQQGFEHAVATECPVQYKALMFQPRVVGVIVLLGLFLQSWLLFLALSALLWWNVTVPARNPFDAIYNRLIAMPKGRPLLGPAPAPRRFAQGMAASFMLAIGIALFNGWTVAAVIIEGLTATALIALIFGRFCLGSYVYYLLHGNSDFANHTLPWARG